MMLSQSKYSDISGPDEDNDNNMTMLVDCDPTISRREKTIMAICTASSRCGCAIHYESSLALVADRQDTNDPYKGLDIIIQRIDPDIVVVSLAQRQLIAFIERRFQFKLIDMSGNKQVDEEPVVDPAFTLVIVPNSWFKISHGEQKLLESEWIKGKGITDPQEQSLIVFSKVKKSVDVCAIRAISAIDKYLSYEFSLNLTTDGLIVSAGIETSIKQSQFSYLTRTTNDDESRIPDDIMPIIDVKYIDPGPVLSIDKCTFQSLGIFPNDKYYREPVSVGNEDETIPSLYSILNQCQSAQGRKTMKTIMMWPLQSIEEIHHRHDVVDFFLRPENKLFRDQICANLKSMMPLTGVMAKLSQKVGGFKEYRALCQSLCGFTAIVDLIKTNNSTEIELLKRLVNLDNPELRSALFQIVETIDFEASKRIVTHIEVKPGVSEEVEDKRNVVADMTKFCQEVSIEETAKYKDILRKPVKVSWLPRIGFLESCRCNSLSESESIMMNKQFSVLLTTEDSIYFKTKRLEELDLQVGDVSCDLIDLQEAVILDMQNAILKQSETILRFGELCAELDCFIAFSTVSQQSGFMRPEFVTTNDEIDINGAFHPAARHNVIPNNIRFFKEGTERRARVMVITGPNSCGKTTYMKTACLVIYMAHMGCFVPAKYARIPIVDAILTRLHSANSISTGLSSFATDLNQVNHALTRATSRSLIAIDEFGKGTQARDGFHLLKGLIAYFVVRGRVSPHVLIATHFSRLIDHLQSYNEYILYKTFKVKKDIKNDAIVYEYQMIDGVCESSLADQVAIAAGVPQGIIHRANQVRDYITGGREIQPRPPCGA